MIPAVDQLSLFVLTPRKLSLLRSCLRSDSTRFCSVMFSYDLSPLFCLGFPFVTICLIILNLLIWSFFRRQSKSFGDLKSE